MPHCRDAGGGQELGIGRAEWGVGDSLEGLVGTSEKVIPGRPSSIILEKAYKDGPREVKEFCSGGHTFST